MPPKEKSKKGGKQLQSLAQLNAVLSTYKAACRKHGVSMAISKAFTEEVEECIQGGGALDKISMMGPDQSAGCIKAMLDALAGYPSVKNLACWSCSIGSEGLQALAGFIRASGDRWWKGSKLRLVEVVADGAGRTLDSWPATCLAHMSGGLEVQGSGHEQSSFLLDPGFAHVTPITLQLQHVGLNNPSAIQVADEFTSLARVEGPLSSTMYRALQETARHDQSVAALRQAAGVLDRPPAGGYASRSQPAKLSYLYNLSSKSLGSMATAEASAMIDRGVQGVTDQDTGLEVVAEEGDDESEAQQAGLSAQQSEAGSTLQALPVNPRPAPPSRLSLASASVRQAVLDDGTSRSLQSGAQEDASQHDTAEDVPYSNKAPMYGALKAGFLVGNDQPLMPGLRPMTFSPQALQQLSLALGSQGHGLKILVLDHNQLGDLGMHHLSSGLKRCGTLQHLSLSGCGIGPVGAAALASILVQDPDPALAALQPKLLHLNVSNNTTLGGQGMSALCDGLLACTSLQVLNLKACGITDDDLPALAQLADTLAVNTSIKNIDLDANFFGDAGASVFFPLLTTCKHILKLRITSRGMTRAGGGELTRLLRENLPAKKKAAPKKKK